MDKKQLISFKDVVSTHQLWNLVRIYKQPGNELEENILDEMKREDEFYEVELEQDVYSVGYITFLKSDSPKKLDRIVLKCMWTASF